MARVEELATEVQRLNRDELAIQKLADQYYKRLKANLWHPSLQFKQKV